MDIKGIADTHLLRNHGSTELAKIILGENGKANFMFKILKTSIMHKMAGERFIVVRSSHFDDITNKVDNVIVDRDTGHTICALDEVSPKTMNDENEVMLTEEILAIAQTQG